jgi:transposase-like protein
MKIKVILTFILANVYFQCVSQSKIIEFSEFHSKVVVFDSIYQDILIESLRDRFTPDSSTIREIEYYLFENNIANSKCRKINFRQYFGYTKNDTKFILVKILNFKNEKKLLNIFKDWTKQYAFILTDAENYPDVSEYTYNVNLKFLSKYEWGLKK